MGKVEDSEIEIETEPKVKEIDQLREETEFLMEQLSAGQSPKKGV